VTGRGPLPRVDRLGAAPATVAGEDGSQIARGYVAVRSRARAIGLLGTRVLGSEEFLWIPRCSRVHTLAMAMPIACVFVDSGGVVVRIADPVPPWRIVGARGAAGVIEGPAGFGGRVRLGERLTLVG
jgi:uncharacterized membrane protein (UPF0127 family)